VRRAVAIFVRISSSLPHLLSPHSAFPSTLVVPPQQFRELIYDLSEPFDSLCRDEFGVDVLPADCPSWARAYSSLLLRLGADPPSRAASRAWGHVEAWTARHVPEVRATLRPGATEGKFEEVEEVRRKCFILSLDAISKRKMLLLTI
jgi:hypothetical protein